MLKIKNYFWFKTICIVLIATFLSLDIAWAHPSDSAVQTQNLSGQSAFQHAMMTEQASRFQDTLFNDIKLLSAVDSIAKYLFEEKEKGVEALTLERMEGVLSGQIDPEFLKGIDLSKTSVKDGVALIHYKRGAEKYVIEVAQKGSVPAEKLFGYEWGDVSEKYVAKVVPGNLKQELSGPAPTTKLAPLAAPPAPVVAEPSKTPDTEPVKPKKDRMGGIGRSTLIVYFLVGLLGLLGLNASCRSGETVDPDKKPAEVSAQEKAVAVSVQGRKILVNKEAYTIKGMCWHPVPQGKDRRDGPDYIGSKADINLMAALGVNTIRVYQPIENKAVLDAINEAGMKVIIGFPYFDDCKIPGPDIKTGSYKDYIKKFKDHPAILMWELGNEFNYIFKDHPEWIKNDYPEWVGTGVQLWYKVLEDTAKAIHEIDNFHPVSTANGELPDLESLAKCPSVDVWGMNVYRWDNPGAIFRQWRDLGDQLKDKSKDKNVRTEIPMYFSETGTDALDNKSFMVDEKAQAQAVVKIWMSVADNLDTTSGVFFFAFRDELWKGGNPNLQTTRGFNHGGVPYDAFANEAWWGWADRFVSTVMKRIWKDGENPKDIDKEMKEGKAPAPRRPKLFSVEPFSVIFIATAAINILTSYPVFALIAAGIAAFMIYSKYKDRLKPIPVLANYGAAPVLATSSTASIQIEKDKELEKPVMAMSSKDDTMGGPREGFTGPGIGRGGIPPIEIEKMREDGRGKREEKEAKEDVKRLFELVEGTVNNPRAQFVIDVKNLVASINAIPELEGKFADITFDKNMLTSQLKNNFKKLRVRIDGLQETGLLTDDMVKKLYALEENIVKVEAASIITSVIASARKTDDGQKLIIGLETGWIPGMDEKGCATQHDAMNALIREVEDIGASLKTAGIKNVEIVHKDAAVLEDAVLRRVNETNMSMSNVIIIGSNSTIASFQNSGKFTRIASFGDEERAFLAGIDPTELAKAYAEAKNDTNKIIDLSLIELISIALELSLGKEPPKTPIIVSYDSRMRVVILLPRANIIDYNSMKHRYDAEKTALASA